MIRRIWAVAINTFREAVRDRVLLGMVGATIGVLLFTLAVAQLSLNEDRRVIFDLGVGSISLFSVVVSVFLGSALLYKEIERKTLYVILPKPLHRHEFLLGKYFGIVITGLVFIAITGAVQLWVTAAQAGASASGLVAGLFGPVVVFGLWLWRAKDSTRVLIPWSLLSLGGLALLASQSSPLLWPILASLLLSLCEVLVLTAVALLFSSFSTPFLTGLFTTGVWLLGRSADTMATTHTKTLPDSIKLVLRGLSQVLPNFYLFVPGRHALTTASEAGDPGQYVLTTVLYALTYAVVLLAAASWIFRKRDFL